MTNNIKKSYNREGYYIAKSLIPSQDIEQYVNDVKTIFIQQLPDTKLSAINDLELFDLMKNLFNKDIKTYLASLTLSSKLYSLYKILMCPNLIDCLYQLDIKLPIWQTKPILHCMANELKIPGGYHGVGTHQDWPTLQSSLNTFTTWIPFTQVKKNSFPLDVIPRSHLKGLYPGNQTASYFEIDESQFDESEFIGLEVDPGDVIVMSNFTVHRSQKIGQGLRLSTSMRFEDAGEKGFINQHYPFTEQRSVKREKLFEGYPTPEEVQKVYKDR